jgi:hypothetical protein
VPTLSHCARAHTHTRTHLAHTHTRTHTHTHTHTRTHTHTHTHTHTGTSTSTNTNQPPTLLTHSHSHELSTHPAHTLTTARRIAPNRLHPITYDARRTARCYSAQALTDTSAQPIHTGGVPTEWGHCANVFRTVVSTHRSQRRPEHHLRSHFLHA